MKTTIYVLFILYIRYIQMVKVHRHSRRCHGDGLRFADREFLGGDPVAGLHRYVLGAGCGSRGFPEEQVHP